MMFSGSSMSDPAPMHGATPSYGERGVLVAVPFIVSLPDSLLERGIVVPGRPCRTLLESIPRTKPWVGTCGTPYNLCAREAQMRQASRAQTAEA